jgi:L-cystine uptake protein TcyP (sodium:dicarboxylate symporter family)
MIQRNNVISVLLFLNQKKMLEEQVGDENQHNGKRNKSFIDSLEGLILKIIYNIIYLSMIY